MLNSARRAISYPNPDRSDRPDIPAHILNLVNALEVDVIYNQGADSARVAAAHQLQGGRFWWSTDTNVLWYDNGTAWFQVSAAVTSVFGRVGAVVKQAGDYAVADVTGAAPLASPALSGVPTAPTPAGTDNSTTLATTAFVRAMLPAGVVVPYAGAAAPANWLMCDGSVVSRTTYAALFAAIGTVYGAGDGTTTFALPDMRGRVAIGKNAATFATLGSTGGSETTVLTAAQIPGHTHSGTTAVETQVHSHSGNTGIESVPHSHSGQTAGQSNDHAHALDLHYNPAVLSQAGGSVFMNDVMGVTGASAGTHVTNKPTGGTQSDHSHGFSTSTESANHTHAFSTGNQSANHNHTFTTDNGTGGGGSHPNLQPYLVTNYIIKT